MWPTAKNRHDLALDDDDLALDGDALRISPRVIELEVQGRISVRRCQHT